MAHVNELSEQLIVLLFITTGMLLTPLIFIALDYWSGIRKAHKRNELIRSDKMKRFGSDLNIERMEIPAFYIFTMCLDKHRPTYH